MLTIHTSHGAIQVWASLRLPETTTLFVIRGAMAEFDHLLSLQKHPTASVLHVHLPGMHTPFLRTNSIDVFADAFDQVLTRLNVSKSIVLGLSAGGLVAMAMRHPSIRRLILADTPISTADLWPLEPAFAGPARRVPAAGKWFKDILGYTEEGWQDRQYVRLLENLDKPTRVLVGGYPLHPRREVDRMPSLVSAEDFAAYEAHPLVDIQLVPNVGHNVPGDGTDVLRCALEEAFAATDED